MRVSGNVGVSVGISERRKTINKIVNNVDVKQEIANNSAVERAACNVGVKFRISKLTERRRIMMP